MANAFVWKISAPFYLRWVKLKLNLHHLYRYMSVDTRYTYLSFRFFSLLSRLFALFHIWCGTFPSNMSWSYASSYFHTENSMVLVVPNAKQFGFLYFAHDEFGDSFQTTTIMINRQRKFIFFWTADPIWYGFCWLGIVSYFPTALHCIWRSTLHSTLVHYTFLVIFVI